MPNNLLKVFKSSLQSTPARLGLPYRPENSGQVRYLGLNFASGRNF